MAEDCHQIAGNDHREHEQIVDWEEKEGCLPTLGRDVVVQLVPTLLGKENADQEHEIHEIRDRRKDDPGQGLRIDEGIDLLTWNIVQQVPGAGNVQCAQGDQERYEDGWSHVITYSICVVWSRA